MTTDEWIGVALAISLCLVSAVLVEAWVTKITGRTRSDVRRALKATAPAPTPPPDPPTPRTRTLRRRSGDHSLTLTIDPDWWQPVDNGCPWCQRPDPYCGCP